MASKGSIVIAQISKYKSTTGQNEAIFSMLSILKTLSFSLAAEALKGLIYHRPAGENSSFHSLDSDRLKTNLPSNFAMTLSILMSRIYRLKSQLEYTVIVSKGLFT